jgi:hypothetical protein
MESAYEINPPSRGGRRHEKRKKYCTYIPKSPMRVRPPRVPTELPKHAATLPMNKHVQGKSDLDHINPCIKKQPNNRSKHGLMPLADLAEIMYRELTAKMTAGNFFQTPPHNQQLLLPLPMPPRQILTRASNTS